MGEQAGRETVDTQIKIGNQAARQGDKWVTRLSDRQTVGYKESGRTGGYSDRGQTRGYTDSGKTDQQLDSQTDENADRRTDRHKAFRPIDQYFKLMVSKQLIVGPTKPNRQSN